MWKLVHIISQWLCASQHIVPNSVARTVVVCFFIVFSGLTVDAQVTHGTASYYSHRLNGARTASGERLSADDFTCAHRSYPFGTLLLVRNTDNGREVVVRVNDRGPFVRGRVVDVSYAAAKELGMIQRGMCHVEVTEYFGTLPEMVEPLEEFDFSWEALVKTDTINWQTTLAIPDTPDTPDTPVISPLPLAAIPNTQ